MNTHSDTFRKRHATKTTSLATLKSNLRRVCDASCEHGGLQSLAWASRSVNAAFNDAQEIISADSDATALHDFTQIVRQLSYELAAWFDTSGEINPEAVQVIIAAIVKNVINVDLVGIEAFCSENCDSRIARIVSAAARADPEQWISVAFDRSCELLQLVILQEAGTSPLQSQVFIDTFNSLVPKWSKRWGYQDSCLKVERESVKLLTYAIELHVREILFQLAEFPSGIFNCRLPYVERREDRMRAHRILSALRSLDRVATSLLQRHPPVK